MMRSLFRVVFFGSLLVPGLRAQEEEQKQPDKEVAAKVAELKEVANDKDGAKDDEGLKLIDFLLQKWQEGLHEKDQKAIVKVLDDLLNKSKLRKPDQTQLYDGAAAALGSFGKQGSKPLKDAYTRKRFPDKPEWVPLRERLLKNLGRTKDESLVDFLVDEARRNHEAALQGAAGEALGNFEESKESIRKEIVNGLLIRYGELSEAASHNNNHIDSNNARERLAAIADKWNTTLSKLTRQNFTTFGEWQTWHNKNRNAPW
jgi:hypothetical protein